MRLRPLTASSSKERVIGPLFLDGGMLVVSTFSPEGATEPCAPAGHSYLYRIDLAGGFTRGAFGAETGVTIGRRVEPGTTGGFAPLYQPADTGSVLVHSISVADLEAMLANPLYRVAGRRRAGAAGNDGHLHACRVARRRFGGAGRDELRRPDAAALLAADEMTGPSARRPGFSLLELLVAMAILAVLASIALPTYAEYVARSRRFEARAGLLEAAHWMERWRTERGRYDDPANAGQPPRRVPVAPDSARGRGVLHRLGGRHGRRPTRITATASRTMASDVCTSLSIDETGVRSFTGPGSTEEVCWRR